MCGPEEDWDDFKKTKQYLDIPEVIRKYIDEVIKERNIAFSILSNIIGCYRELNDVKPSYCFLDSKHWFKELTRRENYHK